MGGSECPDLAAAHLHAEAVASELMRNCHHGTKLWSLRVEDEEARHVFDLFFADVADNGVELSAEGEALARKTSRRLANLIDAVSSAHETMMQSAALLARARRKPQLAYARKARKRR
jgi:broad specificity phosphatase PhoE